jgi:hypothetical protein
MPDRIVFLQHYVSAALGDVATAVLQQHRAIPKVHSNLTNLYGAVNQRRL